MRMNKAKASTQSSGIYGYGLPPRWGARCRTALSPEHSDHLGPTDAAKAANRRRRCVLLSSKAQYLPEAENSSFSCYRHSSPAFLGSLES